MHLRLKDKITDFSIYLFLLVLSISTTLGKDECRTETTTLRFQFKLNRADRPDNILYKVQDNGTEAVMYGRLFNRKASDYDGDEIYLPLGEAGRWHELKLNWTDRDVEVTLGENKEVLRPKLGSRGSIAHIQVATTDLTHWLICQGFDINTDICDLLPPTQSLSQSINLLQENTCPAWYLVYGLLAVIAVLLILILCLAAHICHKNCCR